MIRRIGVLLALVFGMAMLAATPAVASSPQASAATAERQILVMVKHPPNH